jgi:hypothetical protein
LTFLELELTGAADAVDALDAIGMRAIDFMPVWPAIYEAFLRGEATRFAEAGPGWAPLKPSTVARKGFGTIMVETGALRESLTMGGAPGAVLRTTPAGAEMGTDYRSPRQRGAWATVALAYFHQEGLPPNPVRKTIDSEDDYVDDFAPIIGEWLMGGELGAVVPA